MCCRPTNHGEMMMKTIGIIGGGFSGAMTAVNLVRMCDLPLRVVIVNAKRPLGRGTAYGTSRSEHLLNVAARNMSALPDFPSHFLDWLRSRNEFNQTPDEQLREMFVPRRIYGDYLRGLLATCITPIDARCQVQVETIDDEAIDIVVDSYGRGERSGGWKRGGVVRWSTMKGAALAFAAVVVGSPAIGAPKSSSLSGDGLLSQFALSADRGPVAITADVLEFDYRTGVLSYQGNVVVKQGELTLSSDTLRLSLDLEDIGRPREIVAEGRVRIVRGERIATGGRAVFDQAAQTITLSDEAVLRDGMNEVAGQKVVVYLEEERSVVEGGDERVRAKLFPGGTAEATDDPGSAANLPDDVDGP